MTVGISLGSLWGIVTGYYGGTADNPSQRVVDTLMAFPPLILALGLMAVLQQSVHNVIVTLAILLIPTAARTLRSTTLSLKEMGYVESARALGRPTGALSSAIFSQQSGDLHCVVHGQRGLCHCRRSRAQLPRPGRSG